METAEKIFELSKQTTGDESQALARFALILGEGMAEPLNHVLGEMIASVCEQYDKEVEND